MSPSVTWDQVRAALTLDDFDAASAQRRMVPYPRVVRRSRQRSSSAKQAAVFILVYPTAGNELAVVLLRRTENQHDHHSGQISLPGGSQEPGETIEQTALRELHEEVGVGGAVELFGRLASLYIPPSDFDVHPVVGGVSVRPTWVPDPNEVAEVIECPLVWLVDDTRKEVGDWEIGGQPVRVPWYNVHGHKVWGATAIILSELEQRLKSVGG